jgi:hypothetical protein
VSVPLHQANFEEDSNEDMKAVLSQDTQTAMKDWVCSNGGAVVFCYSIYMYLMTTTKLHLTLIKSHLTPHVPSFYEIISISCPSISLISPLLLTWMDNKAMETPDNIKNWWGNKWRFLACTPATALVS